ncbi:hypothetical protein CT0861_11295 [Colletotrichum tofieldiae]|uniref:Transposase n=1 Tax=Colletotrichum tofieldiae TaxID=708197 RepID=A0A166W1I0_9PEZI|nr:hypothetical protein CT0861_11295 [Colletotrichum tofieldiae]
MSTADSDASDTSGASSGSDTSVHSSYCSGGSVFLIPPSSSPISQKSSPVSQTDQARAKAPMPDVYRKVNEWSAYIQETKDSFYTVGTDIAVDEAMATVSGDFGIYTEKTRTGWSHKPGRRQKMRQQTGPFDADATVCDDTSHPISSSKLPDLSR